jgi:hypothetical protein
VVTDSRPFMFAHSVAHTTDTMVMGIQSLTNFTARNRDSIYVFQHGSGSLASRFVLSIGRGALFLELF